MAGSSFGTIFRITTWGESHGKGLGVVIDGCPSGIELCEEDIQRMLDRRRPGVVITLQAAKKVIKRLLCQAFLKERQQELLFQ